MWNLYLDLEESMGTVQTTKAAYERALELKVASPQMLLNFASFLEENKYFEDSFRVYEKVGRSGARSMTESGGYSCTAFSSFVVTV